MNTSARRRKSRNIAGAATKPTRSNTGSPAAQWEIASRTTQCCKLRDPFHVCDGGRGGERLRKLSRYVLMANVQAAQFGSEKSWAGRCGTNPVFLLRLESSLSGALGHTIAHLVVPACGVTIALAHRSVVVEFAEATPAARREPAPFRKRHVVATP